MKNGSIILVDSNMLNSQELLDYFTESKSNKIVLPDYIAFEAYKGDKFESIVASMETISKFQSQVLVLHGTKKITRLKDHPDILKWKFVDKDRTNSFKDFCRGLHQAQNGNTAVKDYLLEQANGANKLMSYLLQAGSELSLSFQEIEEVLFDRNEVKIFRKPTFLTPKMMKKIYGLAERLGNDVYLEHPGHKRMPTSGVNKHCFTFRYGAAVTFLAIRWISRGSRHEVKPERMRNDLVDAMIVAYSTYYDDLLTNDQGMLWLKDITDRFLRLIP